MANAIKLGVISDIPLGEGRVFAFGKTDVAIFHTQSGEVYAAQPSCPHLGGPLADGLLGGASVVCPLHDRVFDLKTGCGLSHEGAQITVYPVTLDGDGSIWISTDGV